MKIKAWLWAMAGAVALTGCTWDNAEDIDHGFPDEVGEIMVQRCAVSGCHTTQSAPAASGLNLETWEDLFLGSRGGSPVVPGSPDFSYLLYAVNTDTTQGPLLQPTMPIGGQRLSQAEFATLRQWILDGARDNTGALRFPDIPTRRKWYVANQGCDIVAVVDAASRQIMRYVPVGTLAEPEQPHNIKVSNDGQYWYVIYLSLNPRMEKYSTLTDQKVGEVDLGGNNWNTLTLSPDGNFAIAVAYSAASVINAVIIDLVNDVVTEPMNLGVPVHGSCAHPTLPRFYVTQQDASGLFMIDYDAQGRMTNLEPVDLLQGVPPHNGAIALKPHEVIFSPDGTQYFVTCQLANEVRAYDAATNALQAVIEVGEDPVEFAVSEATGHLFVSCMEDMSSWGSAPGKVGSIAVIDLNSNALVETVYPGFQPHGMVVDTEAGLLVVANRNVNANGPAPHHTGTCGGRNGYLSAIDLQTLELVPDFKPELASDPYAIAIKP